MFRFDKQCSEKTLSYWQLASVVLNEGDEAYTTNLCQKCFNKHLQATGEKHLTNVQWRQVVERKAYRGRMWKMMGKEPYVCGDVGIFPPRKKQSKEVSRAGRRRKAGRNTGSMAAGIASPIVHVTSEMLPRHGLQRTDDEERLHSHKEWDIGKVSGQEKDESPRMGLRQDKRGFRVSSTG